MLKRRLLFPMLLLLFTSFAVHGHAGTYYTIQVASFRMDQTNEALKLYKRIKNDGWISWYYKKGVEDSNRIRVRAGAFTGKKEALTALKTLQETYAKDAFLDKANLPEVKSSGNLRILITPTSIWSLKNDKPALLVEMRQRSGGIPYNVDKDYVNPTLSGNGEKLVFSSLDGELLLFDLNTKKITMLHDDVLDPCISWSPDDKWIAFIDVRDFEAVANLYVIRPDGTGKRQLTDYDFNPPKGAQCMTVWKYYWLPDSKGIVYMNANTYGTMFDFSEIRVTGTNGKEKLVVSSTPEKFVLLEKLIPAGKLAYRIYKNSADDDLTRGMIDDMKFERKTADIPPLE